MNADEVYKSARSLFEKNLFDEAMTMCQFGLTLDCSHGQLLQLKGLIYWAQHDPVLCRDALEQAAVLTRLQPISKVALGESNLTLGDHHAARQLFMSAFDDPLSSERIYLLVARGLAVLEEWGLCVTVCETWVEDVRDDPRAYFHLAFATAWNDGDPEVVFRHAWRAMDLCDDLLNYRVSFAVLFFHLKRTVDSYQFVSDLSESDIVAIGCGCALRILHDIYKAAGDDQRVQWSVRILGTSSE